MMHCIISLLLLLHFIIILQSVHDISNCNMGMSAAKSWENIGEFHSDQPVLYHVVVVVLV